VSGSAEGSTEATSALAFELDAETTIFVTRDIHSDLRAQGIVLHHPDGLVVDSAENHADGHAYTPDERADTGAERAGRRDERACEAEEIVLWSDRSPHCVELLAPAGPLTIYNVWREGRETFGLTGEAGIRATDLAEGTVMIECSDGHPPAQSVDLRLELAFWQTGPQQTGDAGSTDDSSDGWPDDPDHESALADGEQVQPEAGLAKSGFDSGQPDADLPETGLTEQGDAPQRSSAEPAAPPSAEALRLRSPRPGWLRGPRRPGGR